MKIKENEQGQIRKWTGAVLAVLFLIAAAGCINITIKVIQTGPSSGPASPPPHYGPPSGGNFNPGQAAVPSASPGQSTTICGGRTVSTNKIAFQFYTNGQWVLTQAPLAGYTGWQGYLYDLTSSSTIANSDYYLYIAVNGVLNGCCTNVLNSGTDVGSNIWVHVPAYPHRFTAFFLVGHEPQAGHQIQLKGDWK